MMENRETEKNFQHESIEDRDSIIRYLETLCDGFRKGAIEFSSGRDMIVLQPSNLVQVEIKVKNQQQKSKLSLKISWKGQTSPKKDKGLLIRTRHE